MKRERQAVDPMAHLRLAADRWIGRSPGAVYARSLAFVGLMALNWRVPRHDDFWLDALEILLATVAIGVAPSLRDLERVYGKWPVFVAVFLFALTIPLFFAGGFTWLLLDPHQKPGSRPFFLVVALLGWWGVGWVLRTAYRFLWSR